MSRTCGDVRHLRRAPLWDHVVQAARCAVRRCRRDAAHLRRADGRSSVARHPVGTGLHLGEPACCNPSSIVRSTRRNAAVARSNPRHVAAVDPRGHRRVVVVDHLTRRIAGGAHRTRQRDAHDRASPALGQFDAPPAGRHSRRLELHLGRPGRHSDPGVRCVLVAADVRSLMGVGRTA
jgi:hypothetical protein